MQTINLYDAKNQFSKLVDAAERGEVIVIARHGKAAAKLVSLEYGEKSEWSPAMQALLSRKTYFPDDEIVDRSDLLPFDDEDIF